MGNGVAQFCGLEHLHLGAEAQQLPGRVADAFDWNVSLDPAVGFARLAAVARDFGGRLVHAAKPTQAGWRQFNHRAFLHQPCFEVLSPGRPEAREIETSGALTLPAENVERTNVGHAVGAGLALYGGDQIPNARLQNEAERIDIARHNIGPTLVADADAFFGPDRRRECG